MDKKLFNNEATENAFKTWAETWDDGITYNDSDIERFYKFAYEYFKNNENVEKDAFVKRCKKHTHTTSILKRGICQKFYGELLTIVAFLKWKEVR